jgi:hypothetical protein
MGELLVEIGAQPGQLVASPRSSAWMTSSYLWLKGLVVGSARLVGAGTADARTRGLLRIGCSESSGISPDGPSASSWPRPRSRRWNPRCLDLGAVALRFLFALALALLGLLLGLVFVLALLVLGIEGGVVRHVEGGEELAYRAGEIALVLDVLRQAVEIAPRLGLDMLAPQLHDLGCGCRRLEAREALAHHERDGVLERRVGAIGDLLVLAAAVVAVLEHGADVRGHAGHAAGADGFDPRLLDRIVDRPRSLALGREAAMDGSVMAGEPQRHGIGMPAQHGDVLAVRRRGGSGRRALSPMRAGRSAAKVISRSCFLATARMQPAIERFNGSAGASFLSPGLRFEIDIAACA